MLSTPTKRVKMLGDADREHLEQCALIEWVRLNEHIEPRLRLLFAVPNGGRRSMWEGKRFKAEGVVAGVPDLCLPAASAGHLYCALMIEMKAPGSKPRKNQQEWARNALGKGPLVVWHDSWVAAAREICVYLGPTALVPPATKT